MCDENNMQDSSVPQERNTSPALNKGEPASNHMAQADGESGTEVTEDQNKAPDAPFYWKRDEHERVSLSNGGLEYTTTDLRVPGKNGFDLVIQRRYSTAAANDASFYPVYRGVDKHFDGYNGQLNNHELNLYGLGRGWSFSFPSLEQSISKRNVDFGAVNYYNTLLHTGDGRTLTVSGASRRVVDDGDGSGMIPLPRGITGIPLPPNFVYQYPFYNYHLRDMVMKPDDPNGHLSGGNRTLYYKDGRKARFDGAGKLTALEDKFGNTILFAYEGDRLARITDTWGHIFQYRAVPGGYRWVRMAPEGEVVEYSYTVSGTELTATRDKAGRPTHYQYTHRATQHWEYSCSYYTHYTLLAGITHPTGVQTAYTYDTRREEILDRLDLVRHWHTSLVLTERSDNRNNAQWNKVDYEYITAVHDPQFMFPRKKTEYIGGTKVHTHWKPETGTYETYTLHKFNHEHLKTEELSYETAGQTVPDSKKVFTYATTVDDSGRSWKVQQLHESVTEYRYAKDSDLVYTKKTTHYTYDPTELGNVVRQTETYTDQNGQAYPGLDQATEMTYDNAYSTLTGKQYAKNDSTLIREEYRLSPDKKLVTVKEVYEKHGGGDWTIRRRTSYSYDGENRLIREQDDTAYHGNQTVPYRTRYIYTPGCPFPTTTGKLLALPDRYLDEHCTYDLYGNRTGHTDGAGHTTRYEYDVLGRLTKEIYPDGRYRQTVYNDALNRIEARDEYGSRTRYSYTPLGKISAVHALEPDTLLTSYGYDSSSRLEEECTHNEDGSVRARTVYAYDTRDRVTRRETTGHLVHGVERYEYEQLADGVNDRAIRYVSLDAGQETNTVTYRDWLGRTVKEGYATNIKSWSYVTDWKEEASSGGTELPWPGSPFVTVEQLARMTYDKLGNQISAISISGRETQRAFDWMGNVLEERSNVDGVWHTVTHSYDSQGMLQSTTDREGRTTDCTYDRAGRLTARRSPFGGGHKSEVRYQYDGAGNITREEVRCDDGSGEMYRATAHVYDNRGRAVKTTLPDGTWTEYRYETAERATTVTVGKTASGPDHSTRTTTVLDRFGNTVKLFDQNTPYSKGAAGSERWTYDRTGLLRMYTGRNGNTVAYAHDALGRVVRETAVLGDSRTETTTAYNMAGLPIQEDNSTVSVRKAYNLRGLLISETETSGADTAAKNYAYDREGRRTSFYLRRNDTVLHDLGYVYDGEGRLTEVRTYGKAAPMTSVTVRPHTVVAKYGYTPNGNRAWLQYPDSAGQLRVDYGYNEANLVTSVVSKRGNAVVSRFDYTYNLDGNQRSKTETHGSNTLATTYTYDAAGRLTGEQNPSQTFTYAYDSRANRTSMTVTGLEARTVSYTYDSRDRLTEEKTTQTDSVETLSYRYDYNGNQVWRERSTLYSPGKATGRSVGFHESPNVLEVRTYNGLNQLVEVRRDNDRPILYTYRPDGLRHSKTAQDIVKIHLWDGENIVADVGVNGHVAQTYQRGVNLISRAVGEATEYYFHNAHGDVTDRLNGNGDVLRHYRYDAFGNEQDPVDSDGNPFRYCGEYWDKETDTVYLRARCYEPRTGRFASEDTVRGASKTMHNDQEVVDPLSLNLYTYCHNDPISLYDFTGNTPQRDKENKEKEYEPKKERKWWNTPIYELLIEAYNKYKTEQDKRVFEHEFSIADQFAKIQGIDQESPEYMPFIIENIEIQRIAFDVSQMACGLEVKSLINIDPKLVRAAEKMGTNTEIQKEANLLVSKLLEGNTNPGIGTKNLFADVSYLRGRHGARIFYRMKEGVVEILAKADKSNEQTVINILKKLYK